ncbi:hypothetical protein SBD_1585 [Streptomyces bottropensis ATCC 25435]|uniref:Uncharacterized protein n=1 Tax=Streptomyces bottropensis ATCC 25435 TaxID=1054862 RepID=M3F602_9ACTN|nr:hypothetical protein SBD_1585 [Streptomyces bottropensis ATCC 25435]
MTRTRPARGARPSRRPIRRDRRGSASLTPVIRVHTRLAPAREGPARRCLCVDRQLDTVPALSGTAPSSVSRKGPGLRRQCPDRPLVGVGAGIDRQPHTILDCPEALHQALSV